MRDYRKTFIFFLTILSIVSFSAVFAKHEQGDRKALATDGKRTITYGSIVRLVHHQTEKPLSCNNDLVSPFVKKAYVFLDSESRDDGSQYWIVKGPYGSDRWNCHFGQPLKENDQIMLENVKTGKALRSGFKEFVQDREFTVFADSVEYHGSQYNNEQSKKGANKGYTWQVKDAWFGSRGVVNDDTRFRLRVHNDTVPFFLTANVKRSIAVDRKRQKKAIQTTWYRDRDEVFYFDLIEQPGNHELTKEKWEQDRGGKLLYNTIVAIDPVSSGLDRFETGPGWLINNYENKRRLWTHAHSRHDRLGRAKEPEQHLEILAGPGVDARVKGSASFFMIRNAIDPSKIGSVQYGDEFNVVSAAPGYDHKKGMLKSGKLWWLNPTSRWGNNFSEIVVSHKNYESCTAAQSNFVFEPVMPGVYGDVHQNDALLIRNQRSGRVLWLHNTSRYGRRYYELLASNGDDAWGKKARGIHNSRDNVWHRFRVHHVMRRWVPKQFRSTFDILARNIQNSLKDSSDEYLMGLDASKRQQEITMSESPENELKRARNAAIKIDMQVVKKEHERDQAREVLAELKLQSTLPTGFLYERGLAKDISIGITKRGNHVESNIWAVSKMGDLMTWRSGINPWVSHEARDKNEVVLKQGFTNVSVGKNVVVALTNDGRPMVYHGPRA